MLDATETLVEGPSLRVACEAMGTRFECVLPGGDHARLRAAAEAAFSEIESLSARWSYFSSASVIFRINREAANRPVPIDAETRDILRLAIDTWRDSEGCFDITVGPLMRRWGLRVATLSERGAASEAHSSKPLSERGATHPPHGSQHLTLDDASCTLAFDVPGIEIDLGAIAKGWAIDRAAEILRDAGVTAALLHGGTSSVIAVGSPPSSPRGWPIRLGPFAASPLVHLRDRALGVSAPHGRTAIAQGGTAGHVIDPRSGEPVWIERSASPDKHTAPGWVGSPSRHAARRAAPPQTTFAACIHESAALADAWSTALLVRGSLEGLALPRGMSAAIRHDPAWTYSDSFESSRPPEPHA